MTENLQLLCSIHQNAQMGREAIGELLPYVGGTFRQKMVDQQNRYNDLANSAREQLESGGVAPRPLPLMAQVRTAVFSRLCTLRDRSDVHLAGMLLQGSTMGIIDIARALRTHSAADESIKTLGGDLLSLEQNSADIWRETLLQ